MAFIKKRIDKTIIDRLQAMTSASVEKLTYTQAVDMLNKVKSSVRHYHCLESISSLLLLCCIHQPETNINELPGFYHL